MKLKAQALVDTSRVSLSDRVRQARRRAGFSQQHLAEKLGIQRAAVSQWECAGRALPNILNLLRVAVETQVSFDWLATGRGRMESAEQSEIVAVTLGSFATTQEEEDLLVAYRGMGRKQREALLVVVQAITKRATDRS